MTNQPKTDAVELLPGDSVVDRLIPQDASTVALGPIVWEGDPAQKHWYFVIAFCAEGADKLSFDEDLGLARETRARLMVELALRRHGVVVFDAGDELTLARFCAAAWPSSPYQQIVAAIEAEQATKQ